LPDTEALLTEMAKSLAACLPSGGAVLIEPFIQPTSFICDNHITMDTYTSPNLHLARAATAKRDGNICVCNMHWLVARKGKGVDDRYDETHRLTLFTETELLQAFRDAGFDCRFHFN
jgi:hypothetical protein